VQAANSLADRRANAGKPVSQGDCITALTAVRPSESPEDLKALIEWYTASLTWVEPPPEDEVSKYQLIVIIWHIAQIVSSLRFRLPRSTVRNLSYEPDFDVRLVIRTPKSGL
jgi:hypothetical protein